MRKKQANKEDVHCFTDKRMNNILTFAISEVHCLVFVIMGNNSNKHL